MRRVQLQSGLASCSRARCHAPLICSLHTVPHLRKEQTMPGVMDMILLAVGLGFFALSIAYAFGCDRL
jgi:hypothetical protein